MPTVEHQKYLEVATRAAKAAGEILLNGMKKDMHIRFKGEANPVTIVDEQAEEKIISIIKKAYPDHDFVAEESQTEELGGDYVWIVDPLDGTTNYTHAYPLFCTSIALQIRGRVEVAVVFDPLHKELFHAVRGRGSYLNQKKIHVSNTKVLKQSLLGMGFYYGYKKDSLVYFDHLILKCQALRRDGAAAIDLCYMAMGRFDAFWEFGLSPWDHAAGSLIVEEAGGKMTDFQGKRFSIYQKETLATNPQLHKEILREFQYVKQELVRRHRRK